MLRSWERSRGRGHSFDGTIAMIVTIDTFQQGIGHVLVDDAAQQANGDFKVIRTGDQSCSQKP